MPALIILALTLAAPFEDVQKRFTIDLPEGWVFAPQPGDLTGASFKKMMDRVPAHAAVKVIRVDEGMNLAALSQQLASAFSSEPGYAVLASGKVTLGGLAGERRRMIVYLRGDSKWPKMIEQRFALRDGVAYVVHVETLAEVFGTFEADFEHLFATLRPAVAKRARQP